MSSENEIIETNVYLDALPTFKPRPDSFSVDLRAMLKTDTACHALAMIEEQALLSEKEFTAIDFSDSTGLAKANQLKGRIKALRELPELLIDKANEETLDGRK